MVKSKLCKPQIFELTTKRYELMQLNVPNKDLPKKLTMKQKCNFNIRK